MKFTVFLSGCLLLFLLPDWTESVDTVDINTLARIINYFEENYNRVDENGNPHQYAAAINVPEAQCQQNFNPTQNNFLTQDNAMNVRNAINYQSNGLYEGADLIAAGLRKIENTPSFQYFHSEFLLLRPTYNSPMTRLLKRRNDSCSVFFTLNSPCIGSCLNRTRERNILRPLSEWTEHRGIKAFVFKNIWQYDLNGDFETAIRRIAVFIPVFRCVSATLCYACHGGRNAPVNPQCLPPTEI